MSSTTPNIGLVLPVGSERVSRQIINENNTKIDTAIGALNSKIGTVNVNGTQCDTLDAVKTYLLSIHNSLADGEIKAVHMLFTLSYTGQYFIQNSRYVGYYTRINNATGSVSLTNRTGDIIVVGLTSATSTPVWEFNSINGKIEKCLPMYEIQGNASSSSPFVINYSILEYSVYLIIGAYTSGNTNFIAFMAKNGVFLPAVLLNTLGASETHDSDKMTISVASGYGGTWIRVIPLA